MTEVFNLIGDVLQQNLLVGVLLLVIALLVYWILKERGYTQERDNKYIDSIDKINTNMGLILERQRVTNSHEENVEEGLDDVTHSVQQLNAMLSKLEPRLNDECKDLERAVTDLKFTLQGISIRLETKK